MNKKTGCLILIGAIWLVVLLAVNRLALGVILAVAGLTVGTIFYLRRRKQRLEERQKRLELEQFDLQRESLIAKGTYKYVESFVRNGGMVNSENEAMKLKDLLAQKGFVFSRAQIGRLIGEEAARQEYEEFASKVGYGSPKDLQGFIENLINLYGENWSNYREFFSRLLSENQIPFDDGKLEGQVQDAKHRAEIDRFEARLASSSGPYSLRELDLMTGTEFEAFLKGLFEKMGYSAATTPATHDQGADLILRKLGEITVVQAKRRSDKVGNAAVQEVVAAVSHYGGHKGMVVTTSEFTDSAVELAKSNDVKLIDRNDLEQIIKSYYPDIRAERTTNIDIVVKRKEAGQ